MLLCPVFPCTLFLYIHLKFIFEVGEYQSFLFVFNTENSDFKYTYTCINIPVK